jgi:hypothetical protein
MINSAKSHKNNSILNKIFSLFSNRLLSYFNFEWYDILVLNLLQWI